MNLILITCTVAATVGFVNSVILKRKLSLMSTAEQTADQLVKKGGTLNRLSRLFIESAENTFNRIDIDKNGRITVDEFANYYSTNIPYTSYNQWKTAFGHMLMKFDYNGNSEVELNEYTEFHTRMENNLKNPFRSLNH